MKCLNCGKQQNNFLCENCITETILDDVFNKIKSYDAETCDNEFISEYVETFEKPYEARIGIPEILKLFDFSVAEYYYCRYYRISRDDRFEEAALRYLDSHIEMDTRTQTIICDLLDFYLRNDFIKPRKWCEYIKKTDDLCCELYYCATQFYSMTGGYDIADEIISKALIYCGDSSYNSFLFYSREKETESLTKLKDTNYYYRTKKPYWPSTEERRRLIASIYDEKGIAYPRIELKPAKINESDFIPIKETFDNTHKNYCAFWCAETSGITGVKSIYQIAAVKVRNSIAIDEFQRYIRPWDGLVSKQAAAKEAEIDIDVLTLVEDVDQVMKSFFGFAGNDVLISTGALGNQAKLISRAARYSGMNKIPNLFFDLLDYAADVSKDFDMQNNTREYLLRYFNLHEGKDSLEKAKRNVDIYTRLTEVDN